MVCAACRSATLGSGLWCLSRHLGWLAFLVRRRLGLLSVDVLGGLLSAVGLRLGLCCLPSRDWCCVRAWPPLMVGPIVLARAPPPLGGASCVGARPPPWWCPMCRCVPLSMVRRAVLARGSPHGRGAALLWGNPHGGACCVGALAASWWGLLSWCTRAAVVVRGLVVLGLGCPRLCRLTTGVVGFGLVVFKPVPCAACFVRVASSSQPYGWRVLVAAVGSRVAVVVVLFTWPGWVLCWCVPFSWCGLVRCCVARPMVGCDVLVCAPPPPAVGRALPVCGPAHGRTCFPVAWPNSWSNMLRCCVAPLRVGRAVLVGGPPHAGACCVGACRPR